MNQFLDIYNIIFLVLAVAIFLRLRSVLGRKTGHEQRPPYDPVSRERLDTNDNVVTLPQRTPAKPIPAPMEDSTDEPRPDPVGRLAPEGSALNAALKQVLAADRSFDPAEFVAGARGAYEWIVTAFAQGDRKTLKPLLGREVYDNFDAAITAREAAGHKAETQFVGIDKADIVEAELKGTTAQITVRFVSQLVNATRDKDGAVVDGDPSKVAEVVDVWTFAREVTARDPNWKLIATEAGE